MLAQLGNRQQELLKLLLKNKSGMTAEELSRDLHVTRNAVRQHLAALECARLVVAGDTRPSGGRPEQLYVLTADGHELFPRQYSWLIELIMESLAKESSVEDVTQRMRDMGKNVAAQLKAQFPALRSPEQRMNKLQEIMDELGYSTHREGGNDNVLEADNCVFHKLAIRNPTVCQFDLALLAEFIDSDVDHQECMATGGGVCRFHFRNGADTAPIAITARKQKNS